MQKPQNKTQKIKHDLIWYHVFFTLEDLRDNYCYDDKQFIKMLQELFLYVDEKIWPSDCKEIVDRYVTVKYKGIE